MMAHQGTQSAAAPARTFSPWAARGALAALGVLLLIPLWARGYTLYLATEAVVLALAAVALGFLVGHVGLVSLGQAAFFGLGTYGMGLVTRAGGSILLGLLVGILVAALYGALTGALVLRGHGVVVIMTTLAFAQLMYSVAYRWTAVTRGDDGFALPRFNLSTEGLYVGSLIALALVVIGLRHLLKSPFGESLEAIRQNELKARALGLPAYLYKLVAYVLAAAITGLAGALAALHRTYVSPHDLYWLTSATLLVMVLLGGSRGLYGAVLGAAVYVFVQAWVSSWTQLWALFIGLLLVVTVLWSREGLWGLISRRWPDL